MNNITGECQAGFKRNYSTTDHMFTLLALIQKQFSLNRKMYVAFIDFEKAFESINRKLIWTILLKNGIKGKLYRCIKSMYNSVKVEFDVDLSWPTTLSVQLVWSREMSVAQFYFLFINELTLEVIKLCIIYQWLFWTVYFVIGRRCCSIIRNSRWLTDTAEQFAKSSIFSSVES